MLARDHWPPRFKTASERKMTLFSSAPSPSPTPEPIGGNIPEPGTMSFIAFGALAIFVRAKRN